MSDELTVTPPVFFSVQVQGGAKADALDHLHRWQADYMADKVARIMSARPVSEILFNNPGVMIGELHPRQPTPEYKQGVWFGDGDNVIVKEC